MKNALAATALACALALTACAAVPTPPVPAGTPIVINPATLPPIVGRVQAKTVEICAGFLPTAQTVVAILKTFTSVEIDAVLNGASFGAEAICAAASGGAYASARATGKDVSLGTYRGVRVRGRFVRKPAPITGTVEVPARAPAR